VTGASANRSWLQVTLADGRAGYVFARLLDPVAAGSRTATGDEPVSGAVAVPMTKNQGTKLAAITLDSGITLADWVLLAEDRLGAKEFSRLLVEGSGHRRQHGRLAPVEAVMGRAVTGLLADIRVTDARSARAALGPISQIKSVAGETPKVLAKEARAYHVLKDWAKAERSYRKWLKTAPQRHPDRKRMALGLFKSQKHEGLGSQPGETFKDCPECPEMVVVPAGTFMMGSPASEKGRFKDEGPRHRVTIAAPFAVGKFEVTFAEWDACVVDGGCNGYRANDRGWGRGRRPVINVSWTDAKSYASWLSRKTRQRYRLLSESEWEYVARAGTTTRYPWGNVIGRNKANCDGCGSQWDDRQTAPVGSFPANEFGLHDVHGNVWEWVEDCWTESYAGAPSDGKASTSGDCGRRVLRGGSWFDRPWSVRSAFRIGFDTGDRFYDSGFRIARTLF
jgi:formylglycine-generating enzyme required for sulfatase activity